MKALSWLKYLIYSLLIIGAIWGKGFVEAAFQTQYSNTMKFNYLLFTIISLITILIGVILGLDSFLREIKKEGKWKFNLPKLILVILPCLLASLFYFIAMINSEVLLKYILNPMFLFFGRSDTFIGIFQIILGYCLITIMYKKKTETDEAAQEEDFNGNITDMEDNSEGSVADGGTFADTTPEIVLEDEKETIE